MSGYLRRRDPKLRRTVYTLQAGGLFSAFGNGLVLPFAFLYPTTCAESASASPG